ncbi:4-hydroxybenzoate 3-monooxygenase [Streptomyces sp. RB6PN25]|uniref:4-hydroxybenzoate 3-monooxygenase n=1 Tax=Streptomyces humicola TaxID=2953240 RepID=A0ABT1PYK3_9ACTN|nr:4-hydroxybenzoate 3-monooxygenase [Streptomyces humicola]MCQ4082208.1 4-hydroxybenzoate 3-monooxygenase [Streptomyces humicola]
MATDADTEHTQVVVIGAGPAGLTLANLLRQRGIGCLLLEEQSREFIEQRPRAGFMEEWAVRALERHGLAERLLDNAQRHAAFEIRFDGERHILSYAELTGHHHFVYPQPLLVADLTAAYVDGAGGDARFGARDVALHDLESDRPAVTYTDGRSGRAHRITCDAVAGCDGARGVSRAFLPAGVARHDYGIGWLALLAEAPPSADGVVFGIHPRGLAAHMARSPHVTRFYLQCPAGDDVANWSDERVWKELHARLTVPGGTITEGPLIEKQVLDMHNYVVDRMSHGRLHLAGDAAHVVAPIGAKGMNLAIHDALLLADALTAQLRDGDGTALAGYSEAALRRVWQYQEFSQWFAEILHGPAAEPFRARMAQARLRRLFGSRAAATAFCELYIGKDADW